jgi:hypothetical protein
VPNPLDLRAPEDILSVLRAEGIRPDPDISFKITRTVRESGSRIILRITLWDPEKPGFTHKQLNDPNTREIVEAYRSILGLPAPVPKEKPKPKAETSPAELKDLTPNHPPKPSRKIEVLGSVRQYKHPHPRPFRPRHNNFWSRAYVIKSRLALKTWEVGLSKQE